MCALFVADGMEKYTGSGEPNETARNLVKRKQGGFWKEYARMPDRMGRFAKAMSLLEVSESLDMRFLLEGWERCGEGCGGGSRGGCEEAGREGGVGGG